MLRRTLFVALPLLAAGPTMASAPKKKEGEGKEGGKEGEKKEVGQYVDLASVALPIVVSGQLVNYIFISVRIVLTSSANALKLRAKEPYFRDALVKAAHRTPFTNVNDYLVIDQGKLQTAMMREAIAIGGRENIKAIVVTSQTPKKRMGVPSPKGRAGDGEVHP